MSWLLCTQSLFQAPCEYYIQSSQQCWESGSTVISCTEEEMGWGSLRTAHGNTACEFGGQAHTQEHDAAALSSWQHLKPCGVYFPGPFIYKDSEFHFPRSGQLLSIALEIGVHCLVCKLCFISRCLRFESRIDPSEAVVSSDFLFTRCSFSCGGKQGASSFDF